MASDSGNARSTEGVGGSSGVGAQSAIDVDFDGEEELTDPGQSPIVATAMDALRRVQHKTNSDASALAAVVRKSLVPIR